MTDKELKRIANEFRKGMIGDKPSNWTCFMVSAGLQGFLSALCNVRSELYESDLGELNHVFLVLADGRILDATADQFNFWFPHKNYPKVYLGAPLDIHADAKVYEGKAA